MSYATCAQCGFENPRVWRGCARCGQSLALNEAAKKKVEATLVTGAPSFEDDGLDTPTLTEAAEAATMGESEPPLINQAEAAEAIRTGIERAFNLGAPTLVALEGGDESGKTRLLIYASEIAARIAPEVQVLYAACRKGGGDGAYAPFSRMLIERFGISPASSPTVVRGQMASMVSEGLGTKDAIIVAETTHLLGHVAGIPFPDSPFLGPLTDKPDELRRRAARALRRLIEGEAQRRPVLVLLDDMHFADDEGWAMLKELVSAEAHVAFVLAGAEPVGKNAEALNPPGGVAVGPIAPLGEADVGSMMHVLLPTLKAAPDELVLAITHRSKGNPGAIRELVFGLIEAELFDFTEDGLEVNHKKLVEGELPIALEDAILIRLEGLNDFQLATLERAAVVGETFWDGAMLAEMRSEREPPGSDTDPLSMWPDDEDLGALEKALELLKSRGFIAESHPSLLPGAREYAFRLTGAQALVYGRIEESVRIVRHSAVARWLAVTAELRREGVAALIAPHLEKAGMGPRAGRAYLEASAYERGHLRTHQALKFVEQALRLIPSTDVVRKIEAHHEHGSLLTTLGRYDDAIAAFTEMLRLAWTIGARGKGGAALNRIARVHRQRGENERARVLLRRALTMFRSAQDIRGVAATQDDIAQVEALMGEVEPAIEAATEALEIRRNHQDARGEAVSLHTLGSIEWSRGDLPTADRYFSEALEIRERIGDAVGVMQSENARGVVALERGDAGTALAAWSASLARAREAGDRRNEAVILNNIGEAHLLRGQLDEAGKALSQAKSFAAEVADKRMLAETERNLGRVSLKNGNTDAESLMTRSLALAEEYGGKDAIALAHRALGELRAQTLFDASGEVDRRAEESFLVSIDLFREIGNEKEAARSLAELGYHLIERGETENARERLHEARALMRGIGLAELARVERTLSELAVSVTAHG
jgi:tetratricopeptide (TPR) repeat protein